MAEPAPKDPCIGPARTFLLALFGASLLLAALALRLPPDGHEHLQAGRFLGRFHPAIIHLPIAFILLAALMEGLCLGSRRPHLKAAVGLVLGLAAVLALISAADGWLLAWAGGYRGRLVTRHMLGGLGSASAACAAAWLHAAFGARPAGRRLYLFVLFTAVGTTVWTGDQGGKLSHGESFLTQDMPAALRRILGIPEPPKPVPPAQSLSGGPSYKTLGPILERSCVSCHRAEKHKGGLRLDSYWALMQGGEDGPVVLPGNPKGSEILRRVTLPPDDDDAMPSDGKKPLSAAEVQILERWIAAGAGPG